MQPTTSDRIGIALIPEQLALAPEGRAEVVLNVVNHGPVVDQLTLIVEGLDVRWYEVSVASLNLFPDAEGSLHLGVHLPTDEDVPAGTYPLTLRVASREDPTAENQVVLRIEVLALGNVEIVIAPQRVVIGRFRRGSFGIELRNASNGEQLVDLVLADPNEDLDANLALDRLSLAPGANETVALSLRPRRRPWLAPQQHFPFVVTATRPIAETELTEPVAAASAELVYRSPFVFLAGIPPRLRRWALALAALAVAAAILVWLLGAPGQRGPFLERFVPAQPTVAAAPKPAAKPDAAGAGGAGDAAGAATVPTINRFELSTPGDGGRGGYSLSWEVKNAQQVKISGTPQPTSDRGTLTVATLQDSEYVLEATNDAGVATRSVGIVILQPPDVQDFHAAPESVTRGQPATLSWKVKRAERASLDGQIVDPSAGSREVRAERDTTYTLIVENELGRTERTAQVHVLEPGQTPRP